MRTLKAWTLACVGILTGACEQEPAPTRVHVRVVDEVDVPVSGADLRLDGELQGPTDADGARWLTWESSQRGRVELSVECPAGYGDPQPRSLRARHAGVRRVRLRCESESHVAYLAIDAGGVGALPVRVDGVRVAELPASGILHARVVRPAGAAVRVQLDTSQHPELRPQNPVVEAQLDGDEVIVLRPQFERVRRRRPRRAAHPRDTRPKRLRSL